MRSLFKALTNKEIYAGGPVLETPSDSEGPAGDRLWYARDMGERATETVEGTRIALVLKHAPDCGIATVTVNGKPAAMAEIDAYSKDVDWNRRTVRALQGASVMLRRHLTATLDRIHLTDLLATGCAVRTATRRSEVGGRKSEVGGRKAEKTLNRHP